MVSNIEKQGPFCAGPGVLSVSPGMFADLLASISMTRCDRTQGQGTSFSGGWVGLTVNDEAQLVVVEVCETVIFCQLRAGIREGSGEKNEQ
jgi:hypothetical protein